MFLKGIFSCDYVIFYHAYGNCYRNRSKKFEFILKKCPSKYYIFDLFLIHKVKLIKILRKDCITAKHKNCNYIKTINDMHYKLTIEKIIVYTSAIKMGKNFTQLLNNEKLAKTKKKLFLNSMKDFYIFGCKVENNYHSPVGD